MANTNKCYNAIYEQWLIPINALMPYMNNG